VRTDATYRDAMNRIEAVFSQKRTDVDMEKKLFALYRDYRNDPVMTTIMTSLQNQYGLPRDSSSILKRRFTKLTGCTGKFIRLNGFTSIEKTKREEVVLPSFFKYQLPFLKRYRIFCKSDWKVYDAINYWSSYLMSKMALPNVVLLTFTQSCGSGANLATVDAFPVLVS
jgi:hypothetical protein